MVLGDGSGGSSVSWGALVELRGGAPATWIGTGQCGWGLHLARRVGNSLPEDIGPVRRKRCGEV